MGRKVDRLRELTADVHNRMLNYRNIERLLGTVDVENLFESAEHEEQMRFLHSVEMHERSEISLWLKRQRHKELENKSVKELRKLASRYRIPDIGFLLRDELIRKIKEKKEDEHAKRCSERDEIDNGGDSADIKESRST